MNYLLRSVSASLLLAASLSAMATEPERENAAVPAATAPTAKTPDAKSEPPKVPAGYKVKVIDGETRYCRKDTPLGSRFPTETCMTQAQYEDQERNRDSMRNAIQDRQKSYSINY